MKTTLHVRTRSAASGAWSSTRRARAAPVGQRVGNMAPGSVAGDRAAIEAGCDGGDDDGVGMVFGLEVQA